MLLMRLLKGANIQNYCKVTNVSKVRWHYGLITTTDSIDGKQNLYKAKCFINASGPWIDDVITIVLLKRIDSNKCSTCKRKSHRCQ